MTVLQHIQNIFSCLDEKNSRRFIEFVQSPYFNKQDTITSLAKALILARKDFQQKDWNESLFWETTFPDVVFLPYKRHRLYSRILELLEDFLNIEKKLQDRPARHHGLIENYIEKHHQKLAELSIQKYAGELKKGSFLNKGYLQNLLELEELRLSFNWQFGHRGKFKSQLFLPLIKALDYYYYIYRLELCTYLQYFENIQNPDYDALNESFIARTLNLVEQNPHILQVPHAKAYYYIVKMYHDFTDFSIEIIDVIHQYEAAFNPSELTNIFTHLRSFHIFKAQKGDTDSLRSIRFLYESSIQKGWIYNHNGYILVGVFLNYILFQSYLPNGNKAIDEFIEGFREKIQPEYQQHILNIAEAISFFVKKDYKQVLAKLRVSKMPDIMVDLLGRRLEIKTYFEMGEIESALNSLNAFRVFIQRCENLQIHILQAHRNFASEVRRLIDTIVIDKENQKEAMKRMKDMNFLIEYWWLRAKWEKSDISPTNGNGY